MNDPIVVAGNKLSKTFNDGSLHVKVLTDVSLNVKAGEQVAIMGRSGAGKSTLLHLLGGLDIPSAGDVRICGQRMSALSDAQRGRLRNQKLGFVYQFHHLLPEFSVIENVCMPLLLGQYRVAEARAQALPLLEKLGLAKRLQHKPSELSGGERQRTAIARALITRPACVLADEPTGNLDNITAAQVFDAMLELNQALGTSLIIVTHDHEIAKRMQKIYVLEDGELSQMN